MKLSQAQSFALNAVLCFSAGAAIAMLAKPAKAETTKAWCSYTQQDLSIPIKEGPCTVSQYGTPNGATNYVTLEDGRELFYDGRQQGIDFQRNNQGPGVWLHRKGIDTLIIFWEKPAREPGGW